MTLRTLALIGVITLAGAGLSACGKLGALERPGPIYGKGGGADAGAQPTRSIRTVDPRDRNSDPSPSRAEPIESTNNPTASGPQSAMPDPYNNPQ
ncbi:hypothetical protein [Phenylobacterium aquaticum]|uniref:hypothetical protein n=1 Tax=Phenylobacterium aquaticum TaxID=1763816 RepID=UPI0026E9F121|nr:hypothetical protein [Phenylobacterium aquaticum]